MRVLINIILLICLIDCKGQSNKNSISLTTDKFEISFENINSTENSLLPIEDYKIEANKNRIKIEPLYLESDNLDGKIVKILKGNFDEVKIKYTYDGIFYGNDKLKIPIGAKQDTTIIIPIRNNSFKIPKFISKNKGNDMLLKAYTLNKEYFNSIIQYPDQYGGINSPDYKDALGFVKKKQTEFKSLEQLLTEIDYTKLSIELVNTKSNVTGEIIYNKKVNDKFIFKDKDDIEKTIPVIPTLSINGSWSINCENGLTEFDINENEGYLFLFSDNAIYINVKIEKSSDGNNEYLMYFKNTASQKNFYKEKMNIIDDEISKTKLIGKVALNNKNELTLNWIGLYNLKSKSLEFVNDFVMIRENEGINPIIFKKCE